MARMYATFWMPVSTRRTVVNTPSTNTVGRTTARKGANATSDWGYETESDECARGRQHEKGRPRAALAHGGAGGRLQDEVLVVERAYECGFAISVVHDRPPRAQPAPRRQKHDERMSGSARAIAASRRACTGAASSWRPSRCRHSA